jgi:hypothetical protein
MEIYYAKSSKKKITLPNFEIVTNRKAPPRKTNPKSFWRDLIGSMSAGDWFVLDKKDKMRACVSVGKYARGRYSLYQHPELENKYVCTITK